MILSGWILPNLVDGFSCRSFSGCKEHILVVQNYLEKLDETSKARLMKRVEQIGISSLDDIAVILLGWIKITDYPLKSICYTANEDYELVIQKYINLGYIPTEYTSKHRIN